MTIRYLSLIGIASLLVGGSTASAQTPAAPGAGQQAVVLNFAAEINGQPFQRGQSYGPVGTTASQVTPSDFRMYVSEVKLLTADGKAVPLQLTQDGLWQREGVSLIDFEDGRTACLSGTSGVNKAVRGSAPVGAYTGVRFTLGVPFALNHADPTVPPAPLNNTAMFWNW